MKADQKWIGCGQGTLLHPVTGRQLTTEVVELEGQGRIFEVFHYGDDPDGAQQLIVAAPELLAALEGLLHGTRKVTSQADWHAEREKASAAARSAIAKAKGQAVKQRASKPSVTIEVTGGVAYCTRRPAGIEVEIIDHDNERHQ